MSDQMSSFNARVSRINDPRNMSYRDPETGIMIPKRLSIGQIKAHNQQTSPSLFALIASIVLGLLCVMAARYVRFQIAEISDVGTVAQTLMLMDFALAALMAFMLGAIVRLKTVRHMGAQLAGIGVMMVAMHNLVWMFPVEFAQVYSQAYVDQIQSLTSPMSIFVNGETVVKI